MEKLILTGDLAKGFAGLVGHFKKMSAFHADKAAHHDALHKLHKAESDRLGGHADALDNEDAQKAAMHAHAAFHKSAADMHKAAHAVHKGMEDHCSEMADAYDVSDKALVADKGKVIATSADGKDTITLVPGDMTKNFSDAISKAFSAAVSTVLGSEKFNADVVGVVERKMKETLATSLEPPAARTAASAAVEPPASEKGLRVVPRDRELAEEFFKSDDAKIATDIGKEAEKVDPELRKLVGL